MNRTQKIAVSLFIVAIVLCAVSVIVATSFFDFSTFTFKDATSDTLAGPGGSSVSIAVEPYSSGEGTS